MTSNMALAAASVAARSSWESAEKPGERTASETMSGKSKFFMNQVSLFYGCIGKHKTVGGVTKKSATKRDYGYERLSRSGFAGVFPGDRKPAQCRDSHEEVAGLDWIP